MAEQQEVKKQEENVDQQQEVEKQEEGVLKKESYSYNNKEIWVIISLRVISFVALGLATLVMVLNRQKTSVIVATIGNTPIRAALNPKFQDTPAFVFFVIANGLGTFHNLSMLVVEFIGHKYDLKGYRFILIPVLDAMTVSLVSGGANAAAFMGELGRNGNSHARWNKICDKIDTFCDHSGGAILASFIAIFFMMIITIISIINVKRKPNVV